MAHPGFTAESSLGRSARRYRGRSASRHGVTGVVPQGEVVLHSIDCYSNTLWEVWVVVDRGGGEPEVVWRELGSCETVSSPPG